MSERLPRALNKLMAIGLAGSLAVTGCAEKPNHRGQAAVATAAVTATPTTESNEQLIQDFNGMKTEGLVKYRKGVEKRHVGQVILGACIGWPSSEPGKITVVRNPGLTSYSKHNRKVIFTIFSATDSTKKPVREVMLSGVGSMSVSGVEVIDSAQEGQSITLIPRATGATKLVSKFSDSPSLQKNGDYAFTDVVTGQPIIETEVTSGPFNQQRVLQVCNAMEHDVPTPSAST